MKRTLTIITALYLTGCSVAKPLVLNNQINAPKQVLKAYTNLNTRNGANDFEFIFGYRNDINSLLTVDNQDFIFSFILYAMPRTNPEYSISSSNGTYYIYNTELMYNIKLGLQLYAESDNTFHLVYHNTYTMELNSNHSKDFFAYHLPGDLASRQNPNSQIKTFTYSPSITMQTVYDSDDYMNFYVDCNNIKETTLNAILSNNKIYYYYLSSRNITNTADYYTFDYLYTYNLGRDLESIKDGLSMAIFTRIYNSMGLDIDETSSFIFDYNASFSEEYNAFMDGYNQGLDEGQNGIATPRIRQIFRAIQAFLDFDFGFFKLGHLLGGILVIAIVVFIVRRFR